MKKILVVGSGLSGVVSAMILIKKKAKVYLVDSGDFRQEHFFKYDKINLENSPKLSNLFFKRINKIFFDFYNIKIKNFFLTSTIGSGGGSNFWGGALEIPSKVFQNKINKNFKIKISDSFNYLIKLLCPEQEINKNIDNRILISQKPFFIKKFYIALMKNDFNDPWYAKFKYKSFRTKKILKKLLNMKNFFYIPNTNVQKIKLIKKKTLVDTDNGILENQIFDKVIICCGTVATPILLRRSFPKMFPNIFRLYHTPMLKLAYFNFFFNSNIKNKMINFLSNLPKIYIEFNLKKNKYLGSLVLAKQYPNFIFGFNKYNFFFYFFKQFIILGNLFFDQRKSSTYLKISKRGSQNTIIAKNFFYTIDTFVKKKVNNFFVGNRIFPIPFFNFTNTANGSDSHYTSSLFGAKKYKYSFFNSRIYVLDGSILPPGSHYPTFSILALIREIAKKIRV